MDIYYRPENHNVEIVGEIDYYEEPYEFDLTVVWRRKDDGKLLYADDSGCSCPTPFEDHRFEDGDFTVASAHQISEHIMRKVEEREKSVLSPGRDEQLRGRAAELIGRIMTGL